MSNMTYAQWRTSLDPKVKGTLNLQAVLGDSLDFFILLSSGCGIIGSEGQGNYSSGSTFQDAFARQRASQRQPVRTIDLGIVEAEGYTAENKAAAAHAARQGVRSFRLEELVALLSHAIAHPLASSPAAAQVVTGTNRADPASGSEEAASQRADQRFAHLWSRQGGQVGAQMTSAGELDVRGVLRAAKISSEAVDTVRAALSAKLSRLLAMGVEDIRQDRSVASYGADSLIAVELRNWVAKHLESHIQIFELMSGLTIQELSRQVAERSRLVPVSVWATQD